MGVFAFALAVLIGVRAGSNYRSFPILRILGLSVLIVVVIQLVLGIIALFAVSMRETEFPPVSEVLFTSLHQATGALLLGLCVLLMAWHFRLVKPLAKPGES
jgi:cytochrome b561